MPSIIFSAKDRLILFLLIFIQLAVLSKVLWSSSAPGMIMPTLRILALESEFVHSRLSPYGSGFERDLVELFAEQAGVHPVWLHLDSPESAWMELRARRADLLIGVGDAPRSGLRDASMGRIAAGPIYASYPLAVIHQHHKELPDNSALCRRQVMVLENGRPQRISIDLPDSQDCPTDILFTDDSPLPLQFAAMQQTKSRFVITDTGRYSLWKPFFPKMPLPEYGKASIDYRWFWRTHNRQMADGLQAFWQKKLGSDKFTDLVDKYFGFFPEQIDRVELRHFAGKLKYELPRYSKIIAEASKRYEIDPLLLIALIYQESKFDSQAVSRTGVRGIMQITQATAQGLGMDNPDDPRQSILAGARYLRQLWERLDRDGLADWDRWFLALSAYNQGMRHTLDAMDLTKSLGVRETSWKNVKETFPLLSQQKRFPKARLGHVRGFEAVAHVEAIRYYYYILHGLFILGGDEWEHLGRLGFVGQVS